MRGHLTGLAPEAWLSKKPLLVRMHDHQKSIIQAFATHLWQKLSLEIVAVSSSWLAGYHGIIVLSSQYTNLILVGIHQYTDRIQIKVPTTLKIFFLSFLLSQDDIKNVKCAINEELFFESKWILRHQLCLRGISKIKETKCNVAQTWKWLYFELNYFLHCKSSDGNINVLQIEILGFSKMFLRNKKLNEQKMAMLSEFWFRSHLCIKAQSINSLDFPLWS